MKRICLQAGHQNTVTNCDINLRGSTGAPGEVDFTVKVRDRLSQILLSKKDGNGNPAFQLQLVDANFNCDPNAGKTDFDLFLALHYEADIHGKGGGFITAPDKSIDDANQESVRIADFIRKSYFVPYTQDTGIDEHMEWNNPNATFYYMWASLSSKTPCALIECGVGQNPHDKVIIADTDRVCNAIAKGICKAFNIPWDYQPPIDWQKKYNDEHIAFENYKKQYNQSIQDAAVAQALKKLNAKIDLAQLG